MRMFPKASVLPSPEPLACRDQKVNDLQSCLRQTKVFSSSYGKHEEQDSDCACWETCVGSAGGCSSFPVTGGLDIFPVCRVHFSLTYSNFFLHLSAHLPSCCSFLALSCPFIISLVGSINLSIPFAASWFSSSCNFLAQINVPMQFGTIPCRVRSVQPNSWGVTIDPQYTVG